jgi:hypothetical protein
MASLDPTPPAARPADEPIPAAADGLPGFDRIAWPLFGAAAVGAAILILWFGRDMTFSVDEMDLFMETPDLDLSGALEPHAGHLMLTTRVVYKAIFSAFGVGYLPFQLLTVGTVILTAGLFFAYAGRRIGKLAALAPTLVLLVFGSDSLHVLAGNGFTIVGALACGLGALLALDRRDRVGDVIAAALLCLGVVTYSVALPFVVGAAVSIALRDDRWQRAWIVVIPAGLYVAWWLWTLGSDSSSEGQIALADVLLFPSWAYQSLSGALGALSGFDYPYGDGTTKAGPTLAVLALIAVGWRLWRGSVPQMLWAALAIALSLWLMGTVSVGVIREPDSDRYLYPGALAVLIVGAWLGAGLGWRRPALIALFLLAATGVLTNLGQLRVAGAFNRAEAAQQRAVLAGFEIAGPSADPSHVPEVGPGSITYWTDGLTVGDYLEAAGRYGSIGYSPEEVRALPEPLRKLTDQGLVGALGLAPAPAPADTPRRGCVDFDPGPSGTSSLELAPGEIYVLESGRDAAIEIARFADAPDAIGALQPDETMALALPADGVSDPWRVTAAAPARACVAG